MALTNSERQKLYRQKRKEQVSELQSLRNEFDEYQKRTEASLLLNEKAQQYAQDLFWKMKKLRNENELLRTENEKLLTLRKKSPKLIEYLTEDTAFFYVEAGVLKLLQWPETIGTLNARKIQIAPYGKIDKKFRKDTDNLILEYNNNARIQNKAFENAP